MTDLSTANGMTYFAPGNRSDCTELQRQYDQIVQSPLVRIILEAMNGFVMILNDKRQLLAANQELLDSLARDSHDPIYGLRPGEVLNCIHFPAGPEGCGTSKQCQYCGAVLAILASQNTGQVAEDQCRLTVMKNGRLTALDFKVRVTPLRIGTDDLLIFTLQDQTDTRRREELERVFLHDLTNLVSTIEGWGHLLHQKNPETAANEILMLSQTMREEIDFQNLLIAAESGQLSLTPAVCDVRSLMVKIKTIFSIHPVAQGKHLKIMPVINSARIVTDERLLLRILVNLLKNAFEATGPGGIVTLGFRQDEAANQFYVENPGVIAMEIRPHIFKRYHSTKGVGRGLGTYSVRLFGESYLKGQIRFSSTRRQGTRFTLSLPVGLSAAPAHQTAIPAPAETPASPAFAQLRGWRVLVVDDDESQGRLTQLLLVHLGCRVQVYSDPRAAIADLTANPDGYRVALIDYRMPAMNGIDLATELHRLQPLLPIILTTGLAAQGIDGDLTSAGIRRVVSKPFTRQEYAALLLSLVE